MTGNILRNLATQLTDTNGSEPLKLGFDESMAVSEALDDYLDIMAAGHTSSHQNNHSSSPGLVESPDKVLDKATVKN
jgi:hypothetical protein